mgnify:CR=1 FL=1
MTTGIIDDDAPRAGSALRGNVLGALSMAVWALGFPAADALLATWPPTLMVPGRFLFALLVVVPLWLLSEGVPRGLPWGRGLFVGALGIGGAAVLLIHAQAVTDPVTVAVIASVSPLTGALVEVAYRERRLSRSFLVGLLASVAGGVIATMGGGAGQGNLALGGVLAVGSCLLYSWGGHQTVRAMPGRSALAQTAVTLIGAGIATGLAGALAVGSGAAVPDWGLRDVGLFAVYGVAGMAVSQVLFVAAVRHIGIALASFHINAAPFYVMLLMAALGGGWSWTQAGGAAVVVLGVVVAQRG